MVCTTLSLVLLRTLFEIVLALELTRVIKSPEPLMVQLCIVIFILSSASNAGYVALGANIAPLQSKSRLSEVTEMPLLRLYVPGQKSVLCVMLIPLSGIVQM